VREFGGWGGTPVAASGPQRQGGGKSGDAGDLSRWVVPAAWSACCAPSWLDLAPPCGGPPSKAESRQAQLSGDGRAQRGLDLFLGQNRTEGAFHA
jgi:hypothetical protein